MSIRVIGGEFGGRKLESVPGFGTRPLLGQVREALFNILGDDIDGAVVWDLFAGTGASGIEALSRGARRVVFVEKASRPLRILKENLERVDPDGELDVEVVRGNAWEPPALDSESKELGDSVEAPEGATSESEDPDAPDDGDAPDEASEPDEPDEAAEAGATSPFAEDPNVVFFDPPYPSVREDPTRAVDRLLAVYERCADDGVVVFHFPDGVLDEDDFGSFAEVDLRTWGQAAVAILRRRPA